MYIANADDVDIYKFSFKKGYSTVDCTRVLRTVDYYRRNGNHVLRVL